MEEQKTIIFPKINKNIITASNLIQRIALDLTAIGERNLKCPKCNKTFCTDLDNRLFYSDSSHVWIEQKPLNCISCSRKNKKPERAYWDIEEYMQEEEIKDKTKRREYNNLSQRLRRRDPKFREEVLRKEKEYRSIPEVKARKTKLNREYGKEYRKRDYVITAIKERNSTEEVKAKKRIRNKEYRKKPGVKKKLKEYRKVWTLENKERIKQYYLNYKNGRGKEQVLVEQKKTVSLG